MMADKQEREATTPLYPSTMVRIFQDGAQFFSQDPWENTLIHIQHVGEVMITSGYMVVTCPHDVPDWPPFTTRVPPGCFPVIESHAYRRRKSGAGTETVDPETCPYEPFQILGALVRFQESDPVRWQLATLPEWSSSDIQKLDLQNDTYGGQLNEHGFAYCFMDAEAGSILTERMEQDEGYAMQLFDMIDGDEMHNIILDEQSRWNVIVFGGGWPGVNPSFFGFAEDGSVACLAVDWSFEARKLLQKGTWHPLL
jgi:hypothetical protein